MLCFPMDNGERDVRKESRIKMQGPIVDDQLKDVEFLPLIVSFDKFMKSFNSKLPIENLLMDIGKTTLNFERMIHNSTQNTSPGKTLSYDTIFSKPNNDDDIELNNYGERDVDNDYGDNEGTNGSSEVKVKKKEKVEKNV
ncbi:hypothetical protein GH714_006388 [Hevea brasiliensis]|uniref:Uncharacterized protein n=1 Tax=Hevea brasiliensis TaxID=3981 RepID=A0A6A6M7X6_HEVBR|nr:hypothetical protein GH714_006388 [Hevea brasiliensis]